MSVLRAGEGPTCSIAARDPVRHRHPVACGHDRHGAARTSPSSSSTPTPTWHRMSPSRRSLAEEAALGGARLVALPEYLQFRGPDDGYRASARPIPGPWTEPFATVARRRAAWILVGSLAETSSDPARPYNTSVLIGPNGAIAATYRKIHLFDVTVEDGPVDRESDRVSPGDRAVVADVDGVRIGLSICYDLRFPELYRALALAGAEVLTRPGELHRADRPRPLGGPAPRSGDRERRLRPRPVADRRATRPAGVRPVDDRRPVGDGRRPGARTASRSSAPSSTSSGSARSGARSRRSPTADPRRRRGSSSSTASRWRSRAKKRPGDARTPPGRRVVPEDPGAVRGLGSLTAL